MSDNVEAYQRKQLAYLCQAQEEARRFAEEQHRLAMEASSRGAERRKLAVRGMRSAPLLMLITLIASLVTIVVSLINIFLPSSGH